MPKKKKGPSLDQEYRYRAKKRSSWDFATGLPSAALSGDLEATAKCAAMAAVLVEKLETRDDLAGVKDWLLHCLWNIEIGRSPNEAFCWTQPRDGAPRKFQTLFKQWRIGQHMDGLVNGAPPLTIEAASVIVEKDRHVSAEYARECYQNFREAGDEPK